MSEVTVAVRHLPHGADLPLPAYATPDSAGLDLLAAIPEPIVLQPGERRLVPTGLAIALPPGFEAQVRPRSGLALKHGVTLPNTPGTIDSDYRGPLGVIMINLGAQPYTVTHGERIAQAVIAPVIRASYVIAGTLDQTARGSGGFGSTGRG